MKFKGPLELLRKYLSGTISPEEKEKVEEWYASFDDQQSADLLSGDLHHLKENIYRRIVDELNLSAPVIPFYKRRTIRMSAAAVLLLILAGAYFFLARDKNIARSEVASKQMRKVDVPPPTLSRATLTLADGKKIELDSTMNGMLATQGKISVVKQSDGVIAYSGEAGEEVSYNTLTVPQGSKPMMLELADGSQVWLNVASSITYPTAFSGKERVVTIAGEAYFEIAKNKNLPFRVRKINSDLTITVLGTHFNVNAYDDEKNIAVTLLEGVVSIATNTRQAILKPGEQARINASDLAVVHNEDLDEVMAWKNGRFYFNGSDIKAIMRQVEKWYNVSVSYEADIPYSFVAKISRDVNVSDLFKILELTDLVHFRIEENKITIMK